MMDQSWFEMADIRRRKFASTAWIPLRASNPICKEGKWGHLGSKEEFFGSGTLAVPVDLKDKALTLGWMDIGISRDHCAWMDGWRYVPADIFEYDNGEQIGIPLVLVQHLTSAEHPVWHLHQDFVIALELMRNGDHWVCPNEGYTEVARLHRHPDGRPFKLEAKAEFLLDYLCARNMGLVVTAYWNRQETIEDTTHIKWDENPKHEVIKDARWEGQVYEIHEGGKPFGAEAAVFHVSRIDVDSGDDVPTFDFPTDDVIKSKSWSYKYTGRKLFVVEGKYWHDEWIAPGKYSPRIRRDEIPSLIFFITDLAGTRESKETLIKESRWLWFRADAMNTLTGYRGGHLKWYTQDTGSISCSPNDDVHFGVNSIGLINVYAKDIALLPDWQQRIWAGFNVTPEGGVSKELFSSQMEAIPAETVAPEVRLIEALLHMDEIFHNRRGQTLLRQHPERQDIQRQIHRFRSIDRKGLFALAKDIARLTADSVDIEALQKITVPPKGENWGTLKSLEKVIATVSTPDLARSVLTPLVGAYELRLADAHLPGSKLNEAMKLAGINGLVSFLEQGKTLISNCADAILEIASLLENLSDCSNSEAKNG